MTIVKHELKQEKTPLFIWTASIGFLLAVCVFLFPEIKEQTDGINEMFSSMGSFTAAFGMDRLNFGSFVGYYAIECGNVLGLGGAFYAALCAVGILSKEEKGRTAEFLFDASCQPQTGYYRKADSGCHSDYHDEPDNICAFCLFHGCYWRKYSLETDNSFTFRLLSASNRTFGNLLRYFCFYAKKTVSALTLESRLYCIF